MSDRYAQVILLAEDERSANLLRRYVQRALGIGPRQLRQEISASGKGDAKQWVIARYPIEVSELRKGHKRAALIVHLDADTDTVTQRANKLAQALQGANLNARAGAERISHVIPRRHTETWLCFLSGTVENVDEERDYKRGHVLVNPDAAVTPAASALYSLTRPNAPLPPDNLPSLAVAIVELRRLEN